MKTKLLPTLIIALSIFLLAGYTYASETDTLQPASDITYNENLIVNATGLFDSIKIGKQGIGGVTFFNGTIINDTTDPNTNTPIPVTFGDDIRIDGEIWRIQKGGDPIKISDNVIPTLTNINDFGSTSNRWNNIYSNNLNLSDNLHVGGTINVDGAIRVGGGFPSGGFDLRSNGNLFMNGKLTIKDDIIQDEDKFGAVKAAAFIDTVCNIMRQDGPNNITCNRLSTGIFNVNFGFNVKDNNYFQITPRLIGSNVYASGLFINDQTVQVVITRADGSSPYYVHVDTPFMITIY